MIKDLFLESLPLWWDTNRVAAAVEEPSRKSRANLSGAKQQKRTCYYLKGLTTETKPEAEEEEDCFNCQKPLLQKNYRDALKDHCHITGKYRGAAHNACNLKLRINPKTIPIPVVFHNLRGYDAYHLMQAMSKQQKEVRCIANNMEKYISVTVGSCASSTA